MEVKKINILAYKIYLKTFYLLKKIEENIGEKTSEEMKNEFQTELLSLRSKINIRPSILGNHPLGQGNTNDLKECLEEQLETLYLLREEKNYLINELDKIESELKENKKFFKNLLNLLEDKNKNSDKKIENINLLIKPLNLKFEEEIEKSQNSKTFIILKNHEKILTKIKKKLNFFDILKNSSEKLSKKILQNIKIKYDEIEDNLNKEISLSCKKREMRLFLLIEENVKKTKILIT